MRLHVHFSVGELKIDEVVEAATAEAAVAQMQKRAAESANFLVGAFIRRMTPLQFAQEAARRYNAATGENNPIPATCDEFITLGAAKNIVTLLGD